MTEFARLVQNHPYQVLYALMGLAIFLVINEVRHAVEKNTLKRAMLTPQSGVLPAVAAIPARGTAAPRSRGGATSIVTTILLIGAGLFFLPLVMGQLGAPSPAPLSQAISTGTYRGVGTGAVGSVNLTLSLDLLAEPKRVQLHTPMGTFRLKGEITSQSGGVYLSGNLLDSNNLAWGTMNAHVTGIQVSGTAGAGPVQWQLDLRR